MNNKSQEINGEKQQFSLPFHIASLQNKKVELSYSGQDISTDGGALLLRELDQQIGLIDKIISCIDDGRDQRHIDHQQSGMLRQRIFRLHVDMKMIMIVTNYAVTLFLKFVQVSCLKLNQIWHPNRLYVNLKTR